MPLRASKLLPSIGHAASGAGGTVISTLATYPLDLVNTRLKVQRQLRADGSIREEDAYQGIVDAFSTIYGKEGGVSAFFAGLGSDLAKSAADSFLFFLFYTWFRSRRLRTHSDAHYLSVLEELAVGAAAGMCAKAFTTPVSNVVTRKQTASLLKGNNGNGNSKSNDTDLTFREIVSSIYKEKGLQGLWAGYSASLVLTLNPSLTFFLQQQLKRTLIPRRDWDDPGARVTFLLAAVSKSFATTVMYPFQIAKARVQVSEKQKPLPDNDEKEGRRKSLMSSLAGDTIFATVLRIGRAEGGKALYDGIGGELLKAFFNHGTTMLFKDILHRLLVRGYFAAVLIVRGWPVIRARLLEKLRQLGGRKRLEFILRVIGEWRRVVARALGGERLKGLYLGGGSIKGV